jgi:uncharacterized protein with LGFP repeats
MSPGVRTRSTNLVDRSAALLARSSTRRGFLARVAVLGSALSVAPGKFLLEPGTAYASVCGSGSTCNSGWTAFCCTTNGFNACPTGSLVGGWWKADNNGFCGGGARYYIDCQATCSRCSSGCSDHFCDSGCLTCSAHCASGSCDNRLVCTNKFRYGQCHQEVSCTGPVQCRVVSCTPPWQVDPSCTTSSATDNHTGDHSAPCLTSQYWSPLDQKWQDVGGAGSYLGQPREPEYVNPDRVGRRRVYAGGSIYWTSGTRAHVIRGPIRDRWGQLGYENGPLGYPSTDELPTPGLKGVYNHFRRGGAENSIYWTSALGAHDVQGAIRDRWRSLGWESGIMGFPSTGENGTADGRGRYNHFARDGRTTNGSIFFTGQKGAWAIHGAIRDKWIASSAERGVLGFPIANTTICPDQIGYFSHFSSNLSFHTGSIYWTPQTGAHIVLGGILDLWRATGWETGPLGYPTTDEGASASGQGRVSDFSKTRNGSTGSIWWSPATGAHWLTGPIWTRYRALGGDSSQLGFPTSDLRSISGGSECLFQGGRIAYSSASATTTVTYT